MEKIKDFLISKTPITDTIDVPTWLFIVLFFVVLLLVIVIISAACNHKKEKNKKTFTDTTDVIPFFDNENDDEGNNNEVLADASEAIAEPKEATVPISETMATEVTDDKQNVEAVQEVPATHGEEVVATVIEGVEEDKPSKVEEDKPSKVEETSKLSDNNKVNGKIEICNSDIGGFRYILKANNGQLLYESRDYKTERSCIDAIDKFINAVNIGEFSVKADKFKRYKFILKSPTSNNLIYVGESFATNAACLSNIESVKRFASNSAIVDMTEADFVALSKAYTIPKAIKELVETPNSAVGKWAIEKYDEDEKPTFVFLLYANNGQLLYESRDYASYSSCKNGVGTFIKTVKEGDFYIDPDKSGRYKFVLRNKNNNSLMEYIGPNYSTHKTACNNADSVYRFALVSPIDNL